MIEAVRMVADYFEDGEEGSGTPLYINDVISSVDRDAGDSVPLIMSLVDDSRDGVTARGRWPQGQTMPALLIFDMGTTWPEGVQQALQDGVTSVGIFCVLDQSSTEEGFEDLGYLMRGVRMCINDMAESAQESDRTRNGIILTDLDGIEDTPPDVEIEDALVAAQMVVRWKVRDTSP